MGRWQDANIIAGQMSNLDSEIAAYWVGEYVVNFGNAGDKAIFDDVFHNLKELYNGPVIKGKTAAEWDASTLFNEQFDVVQPIHMMQVPVTISILSNKMSKGKGYKARGNRSIAF